MPGELGVSTRLTQEVIGELDVSTRLLHQWFLELGVTTGLLHQRFIELSLPTELQHRLVRELRVTIGLVRRSEKPERTVSSGFQKASDFTTRRYRVGSEVQKGVEITRQRWHPFRPAYGRVP